MKKDIDLDMIPKGDSCWFKVPGKIGSSPCPYVESRSNYPEKSVTHYCSLLNKDIGKSSETAREKVCGINQYDETNIPPLTDDQKAMLDARLEEYERWKEEGTLDEHTISMEDLYAEIEKKYGCLRDRNIEDD